MTAGVIWVGTDDGRIHLTRDRGKSWQEFTADLEKIGMPHERWTARVAASKHKTGRAYIAKNGYRNDDMKPYLYVTENYGQDWRDLSLGLPDYPINVVFEDHKNPNPDLCRKRYRCLLYHRPRTNLVAAEGQPSPTVVRDLLVHPKQGDLVVGTYGRGAWVGDITPLQQMSEEVVNSPIHLFDIESKPQLNRSQQASWGEYEIKGSNQLRTPNEPNGLEIWFRFKSPSETDAQLIIEDSTGKVVHERDIEAREGLWKIYWDTRKAAPGQYKVTLHHADTTQSKPAMVQERWRWPVLNYKAN